jgi:hypothetical protein
MRATWTPFKRFTLPSLHLAVELEVLNKELGGTLRWNSDDTGGLGFPGFAAIPY